MIDEGGFVMRIEGQMHMQSPVSARRRRAILPVAILSLVVGLYGTRGQAATFDLQTATLADIQAAMDSGALTSEKLVQLYLNRIEAYDKKGPKLKAIITLNPKALEEARTLDAERKTKGPRSQLHGVPVVFKDLIDVAGLPTTAGFYPSGRRCRRAMRPSWRVCEPPGPSCWRRPPRLTGSATAMTPTRMAARR